MIVHVEILYRVIIAGPLVGDALGRVKTCQREQLVHETAVANEDGTYYGEVSGKLLRRESLVATGERVCRFEKQNVVHASYLLTLARRCADTTEVEPVVRGTPP